MDEDFRKYQTHLGVTPDFLNKYLELDFMVRLKDISLLCGMDYASKYAYSFFTQVSRFDHSYNVAMITWNLTHSKEQTLAALFHDVASPVFSHVVDYMNGDFVNQESTEEKTSEILLSSKELKKCLDEDNIDIKRVIDFKEYSVVDLDRPKLCADRLDNIISVGMAWLGFLSFKDAKLILDNIYITRNEDDEVEITFYNYDVAEYVKTINDQINECTHTKEDKYMMILVSEMLKRCIDLNIVTYDDLFKLTEHEMMDLIELNTFKDDELFTMWSTFKNISVFPDIELPPIKNKILYPLVVNKRLK